MTVEKDRELSIDSGLHCKSGFYSTSINTVSALCNLLNQIIAGTLHLCYPEQSHITSIF